jgi:hypothetical protein
LCCKILISFRVGGADLSKTITVTTLLVITASFLMCQEKPPSSPSESSVADSFIGAWKFNPDKSLNSGTEGESINIELNDGAYKFTYDWLSEKGVQLNWWFVTDMKGGCVKHTQVNGEPMTSKSCVTRLSPRKFLDDTMLRDQYEVSSDGRTLKLHREFKVPPSVRMPKPKDAILIFDRVPR